MSLRATNLERLAGGTFDVLVVGGGINGAVSAAALASHGADVALVDRGDFAGFTSMESSNLVWGGFKYLENYELSLVWHLCKSRNELIRAYPSNIKEIGFLAALDETSPYAPWFAYAGASAYWVMGRFFTKPPKLYSRDDIERTEPVVDTSRVRGGIEYADAYLVDNDARFVFSFVRSALNVGAVCANYVEATALRRGDDGMWHAELRDTDADRPLGEVRARVVVNATGPFIDGLNGDLGVRTNHRIVCSKGIHLVVDRIAGHERVLAFFDDSQRLFYVIPMGLRSVIGTTDTRVDDPVTHVTDEDRHFVLEQINKRLNLPEPLTTDDIISERCGVRPLVIKATGDDKVDSDWTALSRKHAIEVDEAIGLVSIFGGKLTDCLNIGGEVLELVTRLGIPLDEPYAPEQGRLDQWTRRGPRWYGEPPRSARQEFFRQARLMKLDRLRQRAAFETLTTRLWRRYGLRAFSMLEAIRDDPSMADEVMEGADYLRVELHLAAQTEMVTKLEDFLRRRSKIAMVLRRSDIADADGLDEVCRILFGDDAERRRDEYFASHPSGR